jgi:hypothetical protein
MKKMILPFVTAFIMLGAACNGNRDKSEVATEMIAPSAGADMSAKAEEAAPANDAAAAIERKIIKTATLRFRTGDIDKTRAAVDRAIKETNGYIVNENNNNSDFSREQYLEIKVPSNRLDTFITAISATAKDWEVKSISATDVTEEYIDIDARLRTKKELETRFLDLLSKARTVEEILSVESQLATVRGEIESMEGRLKYLSNQVSYSSVNLSYYVLVRGPVGFFGRMGEGFVDGWRSLLEFMIGLMRAWPFVILFGWLGWWILKKWLRRKAV